MENMENVKFGAESQAVGWHASGSGVNRKLAPSPRLLRCAFQVVRAIAQGEIVGSDLTHTETGRRWRAGTSRQYDNQNSESNRKQIHVPIAQPVPLAPFR